jgi:hypothetical protein
MRPTKKRVATADQDANAADTKKPKLAGVVAIPVASGKEQGKRDLVVLSENVRKALEVEEEAMTTPVAAEAMVTNVHMMTEAAGLATALSIKQSNSKKTPVTAAKITNILAEPGGDNEAPLLEEEKFTNRFRVNDLYSWDREKELGERGNGRSKMHAIFERRVPESKLPRDGLLEIELQDFAELYQGLCFHDFLKKPTKVQWRVKALSKCFCSANPIYWKRL